jgi:hypothetical protein
MVPFLRMLETQGLSLGDAEAAGFRELGAAVRRCRRCTDTTACIRWLKWQGRAGHRTPLCLNADYLQQLKERRRPA